MGIYNKNQTFPNPEIDIQCSNVLQIHSGSQNKIQRYDFPKDITDFLLENEQ